MNTKQLRVSAIAAAIAAILPVTAFAADDVTVLRQEIEQMRKELSNLRAAVQQQNEKAASKEEVQAVQSQVSKVAKDQSGFSQGNSGAHLAGYGHVGFSDRKNANSAFGEVGFSPIFHYQYKDLLMFETELEIKALANGETEVGLEYANMNLFVNDYVTAFGGKFLSPIGYFMQNLHPAWINKLNSKPPGFIEDGGAAPISDIGMGIKGGFPLGGMKANYAVYVGNGPRLTLDATGTDIESIMTKGRTTSPTNGKLVGGRVGLQPLPGLELGLSGGTSRVAAGAGEAKRYYYVAGADFGYKWKSLDLRGEYIQQRVGSLAASVAPLGKTWKAGYVQVAYRLPSTKWEPVLRFGKYTSPDATQSLKQSVVGLDYWFEPNIVGKVAYEFNRGVAGTTNDANRLQLQFGYGF
ncbi:MAG: hypothetical protein KF766_01655 [Rhodocyclaceae bacterium]|nr:hypothetical protein [Rhodocyclaceae bacterium]